MLGPMALSMIGMIVVAPLLAQWLQPLLLPVFRLMHADPAMFASIIANDMGGYPLAIGLAENEQMGLMSGAITSSMLGMTTQTQQVLETAYTRFLADTASNQ